jgi:hypothetical protein
MLILYEGGDMVVDISGYRMTISYCCGADGSLFLSTECGGVLIPNYVHPNLGGVNANTT